MTLKGNVFIVGLGLIGGSIALSIKSAHPNARLIGFDTKLEEMKMAKALNVVDDYVTAFEEGAVQADFIVLATPVLITESIIQQLVTLSLKENVLITDTGSTKQSIMNKAELLKNKDISFIGGHPMAGSHKSGVAAAKVTLFENAFYLLTPSNERSKEKIGELKQWLTGTHATFFEVTPEEHDEMIAFVSHFPHVVAASLVHLVKNANDEFPLLKRLAAGGFRDITRIASSSPQMWADISIGNRSNLIKILDAWMENLLHVKQSLQQRQYAELYTFYEDAKVYRDQLPIHGSGAIPSFYDLFVDIPDYPGVVSTIMKYLANAEISITNIRILETREDVYGVLRISFQTELDRNKAYEVLKKETQHEIYIH